MKRTPKAPKPEQPRAHVMREPEYLLLDEVMVLLRFDVTAPRKARAATWNYLLRHAVPVLRRGRVLLIERRVLDVVLRGD
jgi:hypothetical protein